MNSEVAMSYSSASRHHENRGIMNRVGGRGVGGVNNAGGPSRREFTGGIGRGANSQLSGGRRDRESGNLRSTSNSTNVNNKESRPGPREQPSHSQKSWRSQQRGEDEDGWITKGAPRETRNNRDRRSTAAPPAPPTSQAASSSSMGTGSHHNNSNENRYKSSSHVMVNGDSSPPSSPR